MPVAKPIAPYSNRLPGTIQWGAGQQTSEGERAKRRMPPAPFRVGNPEALWGSDRGCDTHSRYLVIFSELYPDLKFEISGFKSAGRAQAESPGIRMREEGQEDDGREVRLRGRASASLETSPDVNPRGIPLASCPASIGVDGRASLRDRSALGLTRVAGRGGRRPRRVRP